MKRRQIPPCLSRPVTVCMLLSLLLTVSASAIVLTNGSELVMSERTVVERRTVLNGDAGFTFFVPPGATSVRVVWRTQPNLRVELLAQQTLDVGINLKTGFPTRGTNVATFRAFPNNLGVTEIEVTQNTFPKLQPGTLFIGFITQAENVTFNGTMTVFVDGGPVETLFPVADTDFDDGVDGWMLNTTAAPYPGATAAGAQSFITHVTERGNPDGFLKLTHRWLSAQDYYVAPDKFLTNYLDLTDARLEFDLARINGDSVSNFPVDVRVFTDEGGWKWRGPPPPPIPTAFEFFPDEVPMGWRTYSAPLREDFWVRIVGTASFEEAMMNPKRLEIRGAYPITGGSTGLDNVRLLARGEAPAREVRPTVSSFSAGFDRWARNSAAAETVAGSSTGDADSRLLWSEDGGNGGGRIVLSETDDEGGPGPDAFVAASDYLGIYSGLNAPRFEFDYKHFPFRIGAQAEPVTIRIFGAEGSTYEWSGAAPLNIWARQIAPLEASAWERTAGDGSFDDVLANVVRIEVSADQAPGRERNGLDNFSLLTADSPATPASITVDPETVDFSGVATEPSPDPRTVDVTGVSLELWQAEVTGDIADNVILSSDSGSFPEQVEVAVNTAGLAAGAYTFQVVFTAPGSTLAPRILSGTLTLAEQPVPTPVIWEGGVVQSATNWPQLAAGALGTIYGENLGGPAGGARTSFIGGRGDQLPTSANGVRLLVYETFGALLAEAPILYLGEGQINFQMPFEALRRSEVSVVVAVGGVRSAPYKVVITPSAPGVFTHSGGWAVAVNEDGTLNGPSTSGARTKMMTVYLTGQGPVAPAWKTGRAAVAQPLIFAPAPTKAFIGGVEAKIHFVGLAPGLVGVLQINLEPRYQTPTGAQPLVFNIGGFESNTVQVLIR